MALFLAKYLQKNKISKKNLFKLVFSLIIFHFWTLKFEHKNIRLKKYFTIKNMNVLKELKYTKEHEWIKLEGDNTAYVGITDYAQKELGDIVFVEIETVGEELTQQSVFGTVEAVKTVSDLYLPVSAKILEVNSELANDPATVNADPYGKGWLVKIALQNPDQVEGLLSAEQYEALIK